MKKEYFCEIDLNDENKDFKKELLAIKAAQTQAEKEELLKNCKEILNLLELQKKALKEKSFAMCEYYEAKINALLNRQGGILDAIGARAKLEQENINAVKLYFFPLRKEF